MPVLRQGFHRPVCLLPAAAAVQEGPGQCDQSDPEKGSVFAVCSQHEQHTGHRRRQLHCQNHLRPVCLWQVEIILQVGAQMGGVCPAQRLITEGWTVRLFCSLGKKTQTNVCWMKWRVPKASSDSTDCCSTGLVRLPRRCQGYATWNSQHHVYYYHQSKCMFMWLDLSVSGLHVSVNSWTMWILVMTVMKLAQKLLLMSASWIVCIKCNKVTEKRTLKNYLHCHEGLACVWRCGIKKTWSRNINSRMTTDSVIILTFGSSDLMYVEPLHIL